MCGRTTHTFRWSTIHALLSMKAVPSGDPAWQLFNAAPTQQIPTVRMGSDGERELVTMRWGLIPSWAKDRKIGSSLINARAETVDVKPAFRSAFKHRRCIIPASGFYEWRRAAGGGEGSAAGGTAEGAAGDGEETSRKVAKGSKAAKTGEGGGGKSVPFLFQQANGNPLLLAGLWESWVDKETGELIETCTIITTEANAEVQPIHNRMPVVLTPEIAALWLTPQTPAEQLKPMLTAAPANTLTVHPVSPRVNSPRNNDASLIEPVV